MIFLDEPTSGLDSAASFYVIEAIKKMAKNHNMIVIMTIHQPSNAILGLIDQMLVLGSGREIYFGPTK